MLLIQPVSYINKPATRLQSQSAFVSENEISLEMEYSTVTKYLAHTFSFYRQNTASKVSNKSFMPSCKCSYTKFPELQRNMSIKRKGIVFKHIRNTFKHRLIHSLLHRSSNKFYEFKRSEKELATDIIFRFLVK
jgi:hypothetical protein